MKTQNCSVAIHQSPIMNKKGADKAVGRQIAKLEHDLAELDKFEDQIKHRMHDRMKFMSGKNARNVNRELDSVSKKQADLRVQIWQLQSKV